MPQAQPNRRTQRLLVLTGAAIAGYAALTAWGSQAAHADNTDAITATTETPATPIRNLTDAVTAIAGLLDQVTEPVPVVGDTVDKTTDLVKEVVAPILAIPPPAPPPPETSSDTPPADSSPAPTTPDRTVTTPAASTQDTPQPGARHAPAADDDRAQPTITAGRTPHSAPAASSVAATPDTTLTGLHADSQDLTGPDCHQQPATTNTHTNPSAALPTSWSDPEVWDTHIEARITPHSSRTQPPSPPPG